LRSGLTLIEVAAGLALLGTLLVSVLLAEGRCRRQSAASRQRLAACRAAEAQLQALWADVDNFPRDGQGEVEGYPQFTWRTTLRKDGQADDLNVDVVRLEIEPRGAAPGEGAAITVDVVLPKQPETPQDLGQDRGQDRPGGPDAG